MSDVDRDEAWRLFCEWTESDSLRKHVLGVEAGMVAYARHFGEDEELWAATGILHDLDYEKHPDMDVDDGHPRTALRVPRTTPLAKALFAVDELSGFIAACALVRPTGIEGLTPKSVKKKLKQPSFAAAVDRDQIREAADELGVDFDEHVARVIAAMEESADELGLAPREAA